MSSAQTKFRIVKRRTGMMGVTKICVEKFFGPRVGIYLATLPEWESVYSFLPREAPIVHAALTKFLAEEHANTN